MDNEAAKRKSPAWCPVGPYIILDERKVELPKRCSRKKTTK